jgi:DNA-binding MarR family transcriptional regulator
MRISRIRTDEKDRMADRFGDLAVTMLSDTPLSDAWRVNFLANFFTGPIYRTIGSRFALSRQEFVILFALSQKPGLVARDACLATGLPKNSISRAVAELLRRGLIKSTTYADDRRAKCLELTSTGENMLSQVIPLFEARQTAMRAILTDAEKSEFDRLLMKLIEAMPDWVGSE